MKICAGEDSKKFVGTRLMTGLHIYDRFFEKISRVTKPLDRLTKNKRKNP
jgi:hypothetical protein